jgi:pimeloyl-ACP methyl ester carboxylesterase
MRGITIIAALLILLGCANSRPYLRDPSPTERRASADRIAADHKMQPIKLETKRFILSSWWRIHKIGEPVTVYIEGDGLAWADRTEPSTNPTPIDAVALNLAALDASANVVYIARPCQFEGIASIDCNRTYWTDGRFAREVIDAYDEAITAIHATVKSSKIRLVGYSGGGSIALLVAAQRNDVMDVRTVAGNLDHKTWTNLHELLPLSRSLNPADFSARLTSIPQMHWVGDGDEVMPRAVADAYQKRFADPSCVNVRTINAVGHSSGWMEQWPNLAATPVTCALKK